MSDRMWRYKINLSNNMIMIVCGHLCEKAVEYRCLGQTISKESDINPEGTGSTRKLAKKLFSFGEVKSIKFWQNRVFLTISKKTTREEAEQITRSTMKILVQFHLDES